MEFKLAAVWLDNFRAIPTLSCSILKLMFATTMRILYTLARADLGSYRYVVNYNGTLFGSDEP